MRLHFLSIQNYYQKFALYFSNLIAEFQNFNVINNINLKYIEFTIENNSINFSEIVY